MISGLTDIKNLIGRLVLTVRLRDFCILSVMLTLIHTSIEIVSLPQMHQKRIPLYVRGDGEDFHSRWWEKVSKR